MTTENDTTLFPEPDVPESPSLFPEDTGPVVPEGLVLSRAEKYHVGLGEDSPGLDYLKASISAGNEDTVGNSYAEQEYTKTLQTRDKMLGEFFDLKNGAFTPEEVTTVEAMAANIERPSTTDFLNKKYFQKMTTGVMATHTDANPALEIDERMDDWIKEQENFGRRRQAIHEEIHKIEELYKDVGLIGRIGLTAVALNPIATFVNRTLNDTVDTSNSGIPKVARLLQGEDFVARANAFYAEPDHDKAIASMREQVKALSNIAPAQAKQYLESLLSYSRTERILADIGTVLSFGLKARGANQFRKYVQGEFKIKESAANAAAKVTEEAAKITPDSAAIAATVDTEKAALIMIERAHRGETPDVDIDGAIVRQRGLHAANDTPEVGGSSVNADVAEAARATRHTISGFRPKNVANDNFVDEAITPGVQPSSVDKAITQRILGPTAKAADASPLEARVAERAPTNANPWRFRAEVADNLDAPSNFANKIEKMREKFVQDAKSFLNISRLEPGSVHLQRAIDDAYQRFTQQHLTGNSNVIDARHVSHLTNPENVDYLEFHLGPTSRTLFPSESSARAMAEDIWGLKTYQVIPDGGQYKVVTRKALDESGALAAEGARIDAKANPTPRSSVRSLFGWIQSNKNVVDKTVTKEQETASLLLSRWVQAIREQATPINGLRKESADRLNRFLSLQAENQRWSPTVHDFNAEWRAMHGSLPSTAEKLAYYAYRDINDIEHAVNNLSIYRDKMRLGLEHFDIKTPTISLEGIEGKFLTKFPNHSPSDHPARALLLNADGSYTVQYINRITQSELDVRQIVHISPTGHKSVLLQTGDEKLPHFDYILSPKSIVKSKELPLDQLPYVEGGHRFPKAVEHISQPNVDIVDNGVNPRAYYRGDRNLLGFEVRGQGSAYIKDLNDARQIVNEISRGVKTAADLNLFLATSKLPYTTKQFMKLFKDFGGDFDHSVPFAVRRGDASLNTSGKLDLGASRADMKVLDNSLSPHNLYTDELRARFASERGIDYMTIDATKGGNVLRSIDRVDPLDALSNSMETVARGAVLDNIKTKNATRFIAEFGHLMDYSPEELRRNPFLAITNPRWKEGISTPESIAARQVHRATRDFLAYEAPVEKSIKAAAAAIEETLFKATGSKGLAQAATKGGEFMAGVPQAVRSVGFSLSLGLWNFGQTAVQASGVSHVFAMEPKHAPKAVAFATIMATAARMGDPMKAAPLAKAAGISASDFKRAVEGITRSGWDIIEDNHSMIDGVGLGSMFSVTQNFKNSLSGRILGTHTVPFKEGERFTRMAAYFAAMKRMDDEFPHIKGDAAIKETISRATTLSGDMTRSGRSAADHMFPLPLQFLQYQTRIQDQIFSANRGIGGLEKGRAVALYSLMYGLPVGVGVAGTTYYGLWDPRQYWAGFLRENDIPFSDAMLNSLVGRIAQEGLISVGITEATGAKTDISQRFSPSGNSFIRDVLDGDKSAIDLLLGASNTKIGHITDSLNPMMWMLNGWLNPFSEHSYPMNAGDVLNELSKISTTSNNAVQLLAAINSQKFMSRRGSYIEDITWKESLAKMLTNVSPQRITDVYDLVKSEKNVRELRSKLEPRIRAEWKIIHDLKSSDEEIVKASRRISTLLNMGGWSETERSSVVNRISKGSEKLSDQLWRKLHERQGADRDYLLDQLRYK